VGNYDQGALRTDMLYEVGSNTKTYTAALIFLLIEEGKLSVDDTLYKYIEPIDHVGPGIEIGQLMNHTSGIFSFTEHPNFFAFVNDNWSASMSIDDVLDTYLRPRRFAPGTRMEYSNTNYLLLGKVIEAVEGKPYHEVLRERILEPLGLNESFLGGYEEYDLEKVGTWLGGGSYLGDEPWAFMQAAWAAGSLYTTLRDLAKWSFKLFDKQVLGQESMEYLVFPTEVNGRTYSNGMGSFHELRDGKLYLGHGGTTLQNSEMEYSIDGEFSCVTIMIEQGTFNEANEIQNGLIEFIENQLDVISSLPSVEVPGMEITAFPNPSSDQLTVDFGDAFQHSVGGFDLNVYDVTGALVKSHIVAGRTVRLDKRDFGQGMFFLELVNGQQQIGERKRIIFN
jgi:CubicO group peptidase (beta-lactamase class C family)